MLLAVILVSTLLPSSVAFAEIVSSGKCGTNVSWALDNEGTLIISGTGPMYDYDSFDYYPSFKLSPFAQNTNIKQITINKGVTSIGGYAFLNCSNLTNIILSDSLTNIGEYSFYGCSSLKNMVIPDSVTSIGEAAFHGCSSLMSIIIPDKITCIEKSTFYDCTNLTNVTIPGKVTNIGDFAFRFCSNLTNITIPNGVTNIGSFAFANCSFRSVTIPVSVTSIGGHAFAGCEKLTSINIPKGVTSIEQYTFSGCDNLTGISIPDGVINIGDDAFSNCSNLTSITIPNGVKSIGIGAFRWCGKLTNIAIPVSVTSIGDYAFVGCYELTDIYYYTGTESAWNDISVGSYNDSLKNATIHYTYVPVCNVSLDKATASVVVGKEITLTETVIPENATNKTIIWTTSDENIAIVEDGIVTGISSGDATIYATTMDGRYTAACIVTVVEPVLVESITMQNRKVVMDVGETYTLGAEIRPYDTENSNLIWESSDENIVSFQVEYGYMVSIGSFIRKRVILTAKKVGTVTITVTTEDGGYTDTCEVVVRPPQVNGVELDKKMLYMKNGESEILIANVIPEDAANKNVIWKSNDENIIIVNEGVLHAVGIGTTTVTVITEDGGYSDTCEVTVLPVNVTGIEMDKMEITILEGQSGTFTATVYPENATDKSILWTTSDENIATVDNGVVTGVNAGMAVIIVRTKDGNFSKYCLVKVVEYVPTSGVLLNTSTLSMVEGETDTLTATVKPDNATNKNIIWTSNNNAIATVDNEKVTAVAPGTAVIIATTEDGGHIATCIVTVSSVNQEPVSAPVTSVVSGIVKENTNVMLFSATKNAEIYYTTDGTVPTKESTKYTSPIKITADTKVRAIAIKQGMKDSNISTFKYTLANPDLPYVNVVTNVTGNKGDITTVSVNASANLAICGGKVDLAYDDTIVELVSVSGGNLNKNTSLTINDKYKGNKIRAVWASATGVDNAGEILNVQFRILDTDSEVAYFNIETAQVSVQLSDEESVKLTAQSGNGILTISEAPTATDHDYYTESTINADNKSVNVNVYANSEQNGILVVAEYDKYGKLVQMKHTDVTNVDNTYTINFDKAISTEAKIKMFVWSSFETMKPLSGVEEI